MYSLAERHDAAPSLPLDELARRANEAHRRAEGAAVSALEHAREAGEYLSEAKAKCLHGAWLSWLEENFEGSQQTASNYVRVFKNWDALNYQRVGNLSLRAAVAELSGPRDEPSEDARGVYAATEKVTKEVLKRVAANGGDLKNTRHIAEEIAEVLTTGAVLTPSGAMAPAAELMPLNIIERAREAEFRRPEIIKERRAERLREILKNNRPLEGLGKFNVILADPPWQYEHVKTENRAIENHYPTMELEAICTLPVPDVAADDCVLFLWVTSPKVEEGIRVCNEWGFSYRTCIVWKKDKIGMGYYARQQHELLFVCAKGNLPVPEPENRMSSVIEAPRGEHSAKPVAAYEQIEKAYPEYVKLELFSRNQRDAWKSWGNQA